MTRIKLCGISRDQDIASVNKLRPDYIGFVFWPKSKRFVTPERARRLKGQLSRGITVVGVFVDAPIDDVAALLEEGLIDIAQLHGREDDAYIAALHSAVSTSDKRFIMKAFVVKSAADVQAARETTADLVLLDAGLGAGAPFDWTLLEDFDRPFFLAGGLDADNVEDALARTGAPAVDTSSGIETDGTKDPEKMRAFMKAVHAWDKAAQHDSNLKTPKTAQTTIADKIDRSKA